MRLYTLTNNHGTSRLVHIFGRPFLNGETQEFGEKSRKSHGRYFFGPMQKSMTPSLFLAVSGSLPDIGSGQTRALGRLPVQEHLETDKHHGYTVLEEVGKRSFVSMEIISRRLLKSH